MSPCSEAIVNEEATHDKGEGKVQRGCALFGDVGQGRWGVLGRVAAWYASESAFQEGFQVTSVDVAAEDKAHVAAHVVAAVE